ncbi:MAG TPA: RluA family pseudouridine synthase [Gemmataceae bacterium]|jgi:23S rRNA pseudouridine1911/1915/1917 synthase|nr:RluA family pseudouridine synthase [Gemmataceae bacterium]
MHVLHEDHHLIAVNKPAPLMTQAPAGVPSLEADVKAYLKEKYAKPSGVYLGIPHRLDQPVSGAIVFCRNTKAAQRVAEQFQKHAVTKVYWALVEGVIADESGEWRDYLRKVPDQPRSEVVQPDTEAAKEAITLFKVLHRDADASLVELTPKTGRMHQLRIQAATRGHPVVGDALYGSTREFGPPAELPRDRVIALHARQLVFEHPFRKTPVRLEASLPDYWGAAVPTSVAMSDLFLQVAPFSESGPGEAPAQAEAHAS